ncbi:MAG: hypothetical protein CMP66_04605 [Flavobacteriales bacterium]|nr:hypothetical protein [Flavobacteriales bacterium]
MLSRVKALLRRRVVSDDFSNKLELGDIIIDKEKHTVLYKNLKVELAKKEFKLLELLVSKPGKVFTRQEILENVWGLQVVVGDRTIDVHIRKLREKINDQYIKTVKGVGYKFEY